MSAARRRAVAALPFPGLIDLKLPESGGGMAVDWARPHLTETGIAITDQAAAGRYAANFHSLVESLRPALAGCAAVYTHSPWGEYGHAEHIQVHRAVAALQAELGYTIWYSNYVGAASWPLAQAFANRPCWAERRAVVANAELAHRFRDIYRRAGAWTWTRWHRWPVAENLYAMPSDGPRGGWHTLAGERLLDVAGLRWWPPPWWPRHRVPGA
jgi:LmbE family N-acetylglucosaminyl deacetylase